MKKILIAAAALFCLTQSIFAFDWGGIVFNTTKPSTSDFSALSFYQSNGISLWAANSFNKNLRLTAEGLYKYEFTKAGEADSFTNIVDLSLLKLSGNWTLGTGSLSLNAGRFAYSDLASVAFSQTSDGLALAYQTNSIKVSAYAGYTGLLNSLNVYMTDTNPDANEQAYSLCPGYIPLIADFSLINLARTNISLQAEYFIAGADYLKNMFYADFAVNGAIGTIAGYTVSAVLGSEDFENWMLYGKGNLSFYIGENLIAFAGAEYYSGKNGVLIPFKAISKKTITNSPYAGGLILPQCSLLFVYNNMVVSLGEKIVVTMPEDEGKVSGSDTTLNLVYNVLSDLQLGCSVVAYYDFNETSSSNYALSLNVSMAF